MTNDKFLSRRQLFGQTTYGIGAAALASLLNPDDLLAAAQDTGGEAAAGKIFEDAKVTYTAIIDEDHTISTLYNLVNVPSGVWIDERGKISESMKERMPPITNSARWSSVRMCMCPPCVTGSPRVHAVSTRGLPKK